MHRVLAVALLLICGWAGRAEAAVVVLPLEARGVAFGTAAETTKAMERALEMHRGVRVVRGTTLDRSLIRRAQRCLYEVFCLVEIGEALEAEVVLVGHVRAIHDGTGKDVELKVIAVDVARAAIANVVLYTIKADWEDGLRDGAKNAARRLAVKPDTKLRLAIQPPEAKLLLFGDAFDVEKGKSEIPFWRGRHHITVMAEGYVTEDFVVDVSRRTGGLLEVELNPDLLFVKKRKKKVNPFDKASRREGSGVSVGEAGATRDGPARATILSTPWPWLLGSAGVLGIIGGSLIMSSAQSTYNELSVQPRFLANDVTTPTGPVIADRDAARGSHRLGSALVFVGFGVVASAVAWTIYDMFFKPEPEVQVRKRASIDGAPSPLVRQAVRSLVGAAAQ